MSLRKFLVTGATGATGRETVRLLREKGFDVRAYVHRQDQRAEELQHLGAEIAVGDLHDFEAGRAALEGVEAAYFVHPIQPGILQATAYFAQAAKEVGLRSIVNMSQISARREAKSHAAQDHWIAERVFDWSGIPSTHLRPTLFAEWVLYQLLPIRRGTLRLPFSTGKHAPVAADDQAAVIAGILIDPTPHAGKVYPLYGPKEMTFAEVASAVGRALGRDIGYEQMETQAFIQMSKDNGRELGDFFWQHLTEIVTDHTNGVFSGTNDLIETIGRKSPTTMEEFALQHRRELTPES